jgi:energy-coupling factor transport system substrate-specific component
MANNLQSEKLNYQDLVFLVVISVVLGIVWIVYGILYNIIDPILKPLNLNGLFQGFWYVGGGFCGIIIRKKFSALLGELLPSLVEMLVSAWGIYNICYGLLQGIMCEIIFRIFGYKNASLKIMIIANVSAAIMGSVLDYFIYGYCELSLWYNVIKVVSQIISTIIFF